MSSGRLNNIVRIISLCLLIQLVISWKAWIPYHRDFPMISAFSHLNITYGILPDTIFYGFSVLCLIGLPFSPSNKLLISGLLTIFLLFIIEDINRFQPWLYMFGLVLLSVSALGKDNEDKVLFAIRIILAGTYLWSGVQKFNHAFTSDVFPWLMSPVGLKNFLLAHHRLIYSIPLFEMIAGLALLTKQFHKPAAIFLIIIHLILLFLLGPFGNSWNKLIWPWNAALIIILYLLMRERYIGFRDSLKLSKDLFWIKLVLLITCIMPAFNFIGYWDYDLSGSLYSGNNPEATFYYLKADSINMPLSAHGALRNASNPAGEFLTIDQWALDELNTPLYPQERYLLRMGKYLCNKVTHSASAGLIINEREKFTSKEKEVNFTCDSLKKL